MPSVLIVDDDEMFRLSLADAFPTNECDYKLFMAGNGREAVEILKSSGIDLVITDLKMPEMNGFELLSYISRNHKNMPVIVITAFGTPEIEKELHSIGSFQYLEKPLDLDILEARICEGLQAKSDGFVKGISLTSFLQVIGMERETCTLTVRSTDKTGYMYFSAGALIDAVIGDKEGEEAAFEIITLGEAEIDIEKKCKRTMKKIDNSISYLILEAHRRIDEKNKLMESNSQMENTDEFPAILPGEEKEQEGLKIQENKMNIKRLQEAIKVLKEDLGDGLLATDIWVTSDGQAIAGLNSQPKASALFNRITQQMNKTLKESGFPVLGQYYMLDLADKKRVVVIPLGDYQWGMLIDGPQTPLGLLLNVAIPKVIDAFEDALTK